MTLITDTDALAAACEDLRDADFIAIDTEFHRESTYWPELCLAQVAGRGEPWAVDALAPGIDLAPLLDLLNDPSVPKVFHAGRQDVEIFLRLSGRVPEPQFDTQVAAMVCGFGESVSYETLVTRLAGAKLDKGSRFTDWRRRPLTDRQLKYALADVIHLRTVYANLTRELVKTGRTGWVAEEMAALTDPATYITEPEDAWRRLRLRSNDPRFLQTVRELAAWRETQAQARDLARGRLLKDEALLAIAAHPPQTRDDLANVRGVSRGLADGVAGAGILEAVARARAVPTEELPKPAKPKKPASSLQPMVALLRVLLKANCEEHGVAQQLVAGGDDLEAIAAGATDGVPTLTGWRHDVFGADALRLARGEVALAARNGGVVLVPLSASADAAA